MIMYHFKQQSYGHEYTVIATDVFQACDAVIAKLTQLVKEDGYPDFWQHELDNWNASPKGYPPDYLVVEYAIGEVLVTEVA